MSIDSDRLGIRRINRFVGNVDLPLLDLILKGYFDPAMRVLDAGCGEGRNLPYFLNEGMEVHGIDNNPDAIRMVQFVARMAQLKYPTDRFVTGNLTELPYPDGHFQGVLCSRVLHFAESEDVFFAMVKELQRVLATKGLLYIRMATTLGASIPSSEIAPGKLEMPDGKLRFALTSLHWNTIQEEFKLEALEPLRVEYTEGRHSLATLVLTKA